MEKDDIESNTKGDTEGHGAISEKSYVSSYVDKMVRNNRMPCSACVKKRLIWRIIIKNPCVWNYNTTSLCADL